VDNSVCNAVAVPVLPGCHAKRAIVGAPNFGAGRRAISPLPRFVFRIGLASDGGGLSHMSIAGARLATNERHRHSRFEI
jgi:hypothetical protein